MTEETKNSLSQYCQKFNSQHGEDGVLEEIFRRIGVKDDNAWCVEFGAGDGGEYNTNTWRFINKKDWSAVLVEADPAYYQDLPKNYQGNKRVFCFNKLVDFAGPNSLDNILKQTPIPAAFDFLCIDIDGNDYHVWDSLHAYQPKVVMIEYNGRIFSDMEFIQPKNMGIKWGSSLSAIVKLGKEKGYELVYAHICNAIFVKKEFYNSFNIIDNSPCLLTAGEDPKTRFFQLYDGSIVLCGCPMRKLLCNKKKITINPVWVLESNGSLRPVKFYYDGKVLKFFKRMAKNNFLYPLLYPLVRNMYDLVWKKRKEKIS